MKSIEEQAFQTYEKNLDFFKVSYFDLFQKIETYNHFNEKNVIQSHYDLEYLDGYFDVKELQSGNFLYATNSITFSQAFANQVNYNKNSFSFEGFPLYYKTKEQLKDANEQTLALEGIYPLMSYYIDSVERDTKMKEIEKFIFVGVGLGLHLIETDKKINAQEYLIIEDDIELFYLSLFCTPYYKLKTKKLSFCVGEDENSFINSVGLFLENSFYLNRYLKYSHFPAHSKNKLKLIQNVLASQDFSSFPYKALLNKYLRPLEYINDGFKITNFLQHFENSLFKDKPVLVLGAGPSLEHNIEWLKENHQRFILMAVSSTLRTLHKHNIKPDIVTHMEGFSSVLRIFNGFDVEEFVKDSIAILGSFSPKEVREIFKKENVFLTEEETFYLKDFNTFVGPCIGSTSLLYSIMLCVENIYILGTDFAIDEKTGQTHSKDHVSKTKLDTEDKDKLNQEMSFMQTLFPINGNFKAKVYTNSLFQISIQTLHNKIPMIKKENQTIYNLNNGAKIATAVPTHTNDIKVNQLPFLNKTQMHLDIKNTLEQRSIINLSNEDLNSLKKRLDFTQKSKAKILSYKKSISYKDVQKYLYELLGLVSTLLTPQTRETNNLIQVYYRYFKYTIPIIMDFLNTVDLKNLKYHIKKLDKLVIDELLNITDIYEKKLEHFFETL